MVVWVTVTVVMFKVMYDEQKAAALLLSLFNCVTYLLTAGQLGKAEVEVVALTLRSC